MSTVKVTLNHHSKVHCFPKYFRLNVRDAAWGCDWVGTPVQFQRCLFYIIGAANKEFTLTAEKFVQVFNKTMMNVRTLIDTVYT
jgi:hypothetical protein